VQKTFGSSYQVVLAVREREGERENQWYSGKASVREERTHGPKHQTWQGLGIRDAVVKASQRGSL